MSPVAHQDALFERPPRKHDLPPRWDGYEVRWDAWADVEVRICPPLKPTPCTVCRSTKPQRLAAGKLVPPPGMVMAGQYESRTVASGHTIMVPQPAHPLYLLTAFRCPDCDTDTVLIRHEGVEVVLDDTDYGDGGSVPAPGDDPIDPGWRPAG